MRPADCTTGGWGCSVTAGSPSGGQGWVAWKSTPPNWMKVSVSGGNRSAAACTCVALCSMQVSPAGRETCKHVMECILHRHVTAVLLALLPPRRHTHTQQQQQWVNGHRASSNSGSWFTSHRSCIALEYLLFSTTRVQPLAPRFSGKASKLLCGVPSHQWTCVHSSRTTCEP